MNDSKPASTSTKDSSEAQETFFKKNLPLLIGGGCLFSLCVILLVGGGFLLGKAGGIDRIPAFLAESDPGDLTPEVTVPPIATPTSTTPSQEEIVVATPTPTPGKPEIGSITFALNVTDDTEAVDPATSFESDTTKVHAVFEYSNLSRDNVWERVWYLDDEEMLRSSEEWVGDESGIFDYFLETGGEPLPPGEWTLEIHLDGELLAADTFTIKQEPTTPTPTPTATQKATATPTRTSTPTKSTSGGGTYQLAYTKWNGHFHSVYIANTNGSGEKFVVSRAAGPSWSPDGKLLFFYGEQGVTQQEREGQIGCEFGTISDGIVAIDLTNPPGDICQAKSGPWFCERKGEEGSSLSDVCTENGIRVFQNLDWKEGSARWASVSPDAHAVAFDATPGGTDYRIYFRSILNNQQFRFELIGEQASWSPDGQRLVYRSGRNNQTGIWISNRDDTGHTRITDGGSDSFPTWSHNGRTIAFSRDVGGNVDIYVVNVDGSNLQRLTDASGQDTLPVYTPSGDIIFRSTRSGSWGIWKMSGNGNGQKEIIPNADVGPDWAYSKMDVR